MTTSAITALNNDTAKTIAASSTVTGSASAKLTSTEFLTLVIQQLQYQDPMEPTDNAQFVSQTSQMAQLQSTQDNTAMTTEQQAASLVGENVTMQDPKDVKKTITGNVTAATIKGEDSAITVNGTSYPLKYLQKVNQVAAADSSTSTTTPTTTK